MYVPITKEEFALLSPTEKRIAIAKDVLAQLDAETIVARQGNYFVARGVQEGRIDDLPLLSAVEKCEVCALGAAFVSAAQLSGAIVRDLKSYYGYANGSLNVDYHTTLAKYFTPAQASDIEDVFEGWEGDDSDDIPEDLIPASVAPRERLRMVFENIIANDGEFVSEDFKSSVA